MYMIKIIIILRKYIYYCIFDKFMYYSVVRVICICIEKLFGNKDLVVIIYVFVVYGLFLVGFM